MCVWPPPAHTPDPTKARPPPPPTTLPPHLHQLVQSLLSRLQDLEAYQIPQLSQCRGPLDFHHELAQAVRSELAGCRRDLDELRLEVDDLEKAKDRLAAADHVNQVQLRLDQCTKQYRQAVVQSKRQIDASTHLFARDELLSSGASQSGRESPTPYSRGGVPRSSTPVPGQSADDALMSATSDVTEGLRRTLQLMQQEVDRSLVSNELLESQTQTMSLTSTQYSTFSTLLTTSKSLITSLERADVLDRLLLFGAFAFFVAVCAHIFKKRVLDRGIKVAGALAGVVEKGGRALAGGAGGKEAGEVVKREVTAEVARAAATATAVAGALKAGVTGLAERARGGRTENEQARETEVPFEEIVPPSPADPTRHATTPVEELFHPIQAEEPIPVLHEPIDRLSDEGAAVSSSLYPLPAESTEIPAPPSSSSSIPPSPSQPPARATVATSPAEPPSTPSPSHHGSHAGVEEHDEVLTPSEAATQEAEMPSPSPSSAVAAPPSDADLASAASTPVPLSASPSSPVAAPSSDADLASAASTPIPLSASPSSPVAAPSSDADLASAASTPIPLSASPSSPVAAPSSDADLASAASTPIPLSASPSASSLTAVSPPAPSPSPAAESDEPIIVAPRQRHPPTPSLSSEEADELLFETPGQPELAETAEAKEREEELTSGRTRVAPECEVERAEEESPTEVPTVAEELVAAKETLHSPDVEVDPPSFAAEESATEEQAADKIVSAPTPVPAEADELPPSEPVQTDSGVVVPPAIAEEVREPTAFDEIADATAEPTVVAPSSSTASDSLVEPPSPSSPSSGTLDPAPSPPEPALATAIDEDALPTSSHVYPPSSVEDVPSATQEEDLDASAPGAFEEAAEEAFEGHVEEGEDTGLREAEVTAEVPRAAATATAVAPALKAGVAGLAERVRGGRTEDEQARKTEVPFDEIADATAEPTVVAPFSSPASDSLVEPPSPSSPSSGSLDPAPSLPEPALAVAADEDALPTSSHVYPPSSVEDVPSSPASDPLVEPPSPSSPSSGSLDPAPSLPEPALAVAADEDALPTSSHVYPPSSVEDVPSSPASDPLVEPPSPSSPSSGSLDPAPSPPKPALAAAADEDALPNSSHVYPPSSVEDVPSATQEEDLDASAPGVFEEAAEEAVEGHVGEEEDTGLREAEERLRELEEEGGREEEFASDGEDQAARRDEL
ncbi:hypothetical protein JCM21900_001087 [Sporobolomyces salmonicolor]